MDVNTSNFKEEVLDVKGMPVMVDFWAEWCVPCKLVSPVLDEIAKEYNGKLKYTKLETDESPEIGNKYGIMSIPTIIIFKNGEEVSRSIGVQPKENFVKAVQQVI